MTGGDDVVVLVEGDSDAAVVRVLAAQRGLGPVVVLPTGGAMGARSTLAALASRPSVVLALCDEQEAPHVERALTGASDALLVCRADLEDELIRGLGVEAALAVLAAGDLRSFRTLQGQPAHRGGEPAAQLRRFIAAGSGRKHRIDTALAARFPPGAEPAPLAALLDALVAVRPRTGAGGSHGTPSGS